MRKQLKSALFFLALTPLFASAKNSSNDCHSWPMNMAEVWLKNSGFIKIPDIDESRTEVKLLSSEKKPHNLYTNIFKFVFYTKDHKKFEVITQNDASDDECSITEVNSYLVSHSSINY
ncbi:hypothetical protein SAMN05216522_113104 [Rosenbergiella nectarea]|uniref:Uncharacterized protein n=1 Tax=Rosenbergiella nectarea TaxID=988801 RepID=A0A1H9M5Q3_9GAMM|nr:hypothetical protein [Rosenbergiella nectarea]SER18994.1 hypothetical protein SAMN05216522_113104 [Rosenbergiella nectarea]